MKEFLWFIAALFSIGLFAFLGGSLAFQVYERGWSNWWLLLEIPIVAMGAAGELYCVNRIVD